MLEAFLKERLGFTSFRAGQKEVIEDILSGSDVFARLPTGSGKTLCYFLSGLLLGGLTLIVSPLLSLMEDQVRQIKLMGEKKAAALNSFLSPEEKRHLLKHLSDLRFLFISPEMLQMEGVLTALKRNGVQLFVVDEAHCVSQWGYDFRPDYLKLSSIKKAVQSPVCLALTATADRRVQEDIISQLGIENCKTHLYSIDRRNIALKVENHASVFQKYDALVKFSKELKGPGLIYFSSREATEQAADLIRRKTDGNLRVAAYHAGMSTDDRLFIQNQFLNDQLDLVCSTNAFGMGLNKSNIRFVIHFHYPAHLNAYVQEMGRAGRDGLPSLAIVLVSPDDHLLPEAMIDRDFPNEMTFQRIYDVVQEKGWSPQVFYKTALEIGMTETGARFLSEQAVLLDSASYERSREALKKEIEKRKRQKYGDLGAIRIWLQTSDCRRTHLLKAYDETLKEKPEACCDHCGLEIERFHSSEEEHQERPSLLENWEKRLHDLIPFKRASL